VIRYTKQYRAWKIALKEIPMHKPAAILDGLEVSEVVLTDVRRAIDAHVAGGGQRPGLAVVLVGTDHASQIYVRAKRRDCEKAGIRTQDFDLPESTTQAELLGLIQQLNRDPEIHGVLVQLPLPPQIDEIAITNSISSSKDVDGFHAFNVGRLALRQHGLRPCTPRGIMALLHYYGIDAKGHHCVIVGASNIVGRPMGLEMLIQGATVTTCHRFTRNLEHFVRQADILIVAVGRRDIVDAGWVREGAVVIDVGINRLENGKLVGDIDFEAAAQRASWITPVPGGVGPMTRATLMLNTAEAAGIFISEPHKQSS